MPIVFANNCVLLKEGEENLYYWLLHEVQLLDMGSPTTKERLFAARKALKDYAHEYKHWKAAAEIKSVEQKRLGYQFHMVHPLGVREGAALISIPITVIVGHMTADENIAIATAPGNAMSNSDIFMRDQFQNLKNE